MPGRALLALFLCLSYSAEGAGSEAQKLQSFHSIFEPSGLVHVGGDEFILVEDEPERPFQRIKLDPDGGVLELGELALTGDLVRLNDLEGVAFDGQYLYAITSHSLTKKGKAGKDRTQLIRFDYVDGQLRKTRRVVDLKRVLINRLSVAFSDLSPDQLAAAINIEALAWSPMDESLYIGFRKPRLNGRSAIMRIQIPGRMFEQQSAADIKTSLYWLDLDGKGIRSMNWDSTLQNFIIVSGGKKSKGKGFDLWRWQANPETPAIRMTSADKPLPPGTEGLATFARENQSGMLLVIDDGSEKKSRPAHYQLFSFPPR